MTGTNAVVFVALVLLPAAAPASTKVLFSSDYTADDTGYFTFETFDPEISARMLWDDTQGFPSPGSLRLELDEHGIGRALGPCLPFDLGVKYRIRADVLSVAEGSPRPLCELRIATYDEPDCSDSGAITSDTQHTSQVWDPVEVELLTVDPEGAIRFGVAMGRFTGTGPSSCNFDNLEILLEGATAASTLGLPATIVFVSVLAGAGILFARQHH